MKTKDGKGFIFLPSSVFYCYDLGQDLIISPGYCLLTGFLISNIIL